MQSLKAKFGKFAVSSKKMAQVNGGKMAHCPAHLRTVQGCKDYWGSDTSGAASCIASCC